MNSGRKVPLSGGVDDLISNDADDFDGIEEEHDHRASACAEKIVKCFRHVSRQLDNHEAWHLFSEFVRLYKPKKKKGPKGPHDSNFDWALLAVYDSAPRGKKRKAIEAFGKKQKNLAPDAAHQHLKRLLRSRKSIADWFARNDKRLQTH